jgi:hypothetical protein
LLEVYPSGTYPMKDVNLGITVEVFRSAEGYSAFAAYNHDPEGCKEGHHRYNQQKAIKMAVKKLKEERRKHLKLV